MTTPRREATLQVVLTREQANLLRELAWQQRLNVSALLRRVILAKFGKMLVK